MNPIISNLFRLPVRRVDVLKKLKKNLKKNNYQGLCLALLDACYEMIIKLHEQKLL